MNPVAALLLPVLAVALAGTTVSSPPDHGGQSTVRAVPRRWVTPDERVPSAAPKLRQSNAPDSPALRSRWEWPLQPQPAVVRPFLRPATKYGAGHRGVDLAASSGQEVLAVEAGTVTHVGSIAGRGTVTVLHSSGLRSTYEPVDPAVTTGSSVARGAPLGGLEEGGSHCAPASCLHLGALRGEVYLDPLVFLMGGQRVRLLPMGQSFTGQAGTGQASDG
ncbi:MAG: peptidoglycan DD-metalloendopeptidase family protein [Pedococcus sp.]